MAATKLDWVVVANEAEAIVYARTGRRDPLAEVLALHNEAARRKEAELTTDRAGRSFDSHGQGRHALGRDISGPKRRAAESFARDISARLAQAFRSGECTRFALIAAPRFLGLLRRELTRSGLPQPFRTVDKDVVSGGAEQIRSLLD